MQPFPYKSGARACGKLSATTCTRGVAGALVNWLFVFFEFFDFPTCKRAGGLIFFVLLFRGVVAQLVSAPDCRSGGRGFESRPPRHFFYSGAFPVRELFDVMLLAVLQGVAEFLPISSSGHLVIAQNFLGINAPGMRLEIVLHLGTLVSIIAFYRKTILELICGALRGDRASWATVGYIVLSAIPATFFYFLCHDRVDAFYESPRAVGGFLVFTGVVLCALRWMKCGDGPVTATRALLIGIAQAVAILPGVSRSGMTIAAARVTGVTPDRSAEFSFLMCLPLLVGAALLDVAGFTPQQGADAMAPWLLLTGAVVSAAVGYAALAFLVRTLRGGRFWLFGLYCLVAGCVTLVFA